jgi:hypothetical protein
MFKQADCKTKNSNQNYVKSKWYQITSYYCQLVNGQFAEFSEILIGDFTAKFTHIEGNLIWFMWIFVSNNSFCSLMLLAIFF